MNLLPVFKELRYYLLTLIIMFSSAGCVRGMQPNDVIIDGWQEEDENQHEHQHTHDRKNDGDNTTLNQQGGGSTTDDRYNQYQGQSPREVMAHAHDHDTQLFEFQQSNAVHTSSFASSVPSQGHEDSPHNVEIRRKKPYDKDNQDPQGSSDEDQESDDLDQLSRLASVHEEEQRFGNLVHDVTHHLEEALPNLPAVVVTEKFRVDFTKKLVDEGVILLPQNGEKQGTIPVRGFPKQANQDKHKARESIEQRYNDDARRNFYDIEMTNRHDYDHKDMQQEQEIEDDVERRIPNGDTVEEEQYVIDRGRLRQLLGPLQHDVVDLLQNATHYIQLAQALPASKQLQAALVQAQERRAKWVASLGALLRFDEVVEDYTTPELLLQAAIEAVISPAPLDAATVQDEQVATLVRYLYWKFADRGLSDDLQFYELTIYHRRYPPLRGDSVRTLNLQGPSSRNFGMSTPQKVGIVVAGGVTLTAFGRLAYNKVVRPAAEEEEEESYE